MPFKVLPTQPLPQLPWQKAPLLRYVLFVASGIVLGWSLRTQVDSLCWFVFLAVVAGICLAGSLHLKGIAYQRLGTWVAPLVLLLSGATLAQLRYEQIHVEWPESPQCWQAKVKTIHRQIEPKTVQVDVQLQHSDSRYHDKTVRLRLTGTETGRLQTATPLLFSARITSGYSARNPGDFDYTSYLYTHGISGAASARDRWKIFTGKSLTLTFAERMQRLRQHLVSNYARYFQGDELSILAALTLGDKSTLTAETRQLFSENGVSHILALSGLHLGILFSLLNLFFLRWLRKRSVFLVANALCIAALWLFVWMVGLPVSLLRAAWMFTLMQVGYCFHRGSGATLSNLAFAAFVLLIFSPLSLFDVGFQLSFSAVLGIVLCNAYLWQRFPLPVWSDYDPVYGNLVKARSYGLPARRYSYFRLMQVGYGFIRQIAYPFFTVSLSAQLGTLPFILYYFHQFSPYALLANVVVIPSAYLLLGGSLLFFLLPFDFVRQGLTLLLQGVLQGMTGVLNIMSRWPGASFTVYLHPLTLCLLLVIPCLLYARLQVRYRPLRRRYLYAVVAMSSVILVTEALRLRPQHLPPQIIVYNVPRTTVVHFIHQADRSYLYASVPPDTLRPRLTYIRRNFFNPHHMAEPQVLSRAPFRDDVLWADRCHFVFGSHRLYVLCAPLSVKPNARPHALHTLVVGRGCSDNLATVLRVFRPRRVILDGSLSQNVRSRWVADCRRAGIACHDVRSRGAYVYELP